MQIPHTPVLLDEVVKAFLPVKDGLIVDCTLGYGGHTLALLNSYPNMKIAAFDRDIEAINFTKKRAANYQDRITFHHQRYSQIFKELDFGRVSGVLADIGLSSLQIDKDGRGFGFGSSKLDMRMDQSDSLSAKEVVNGYNKDELVRIFCEYGEIPNAHIVADRIVKYRANKEIVSSKELADIVNGIKIQNRKLKMQTLVFQAIRIEVNRELDELNALLDGIENSSINNAIVAIITFHSLEDRVVKNKFKKWQTSCICPEFAIRCECGNNHAIGEAVTKKPLRPSLAELASNPRSSSSKLRVFHIKRG